MSECLHTILEPEGVCPWQTFSAPQEEDPWGISRILLRWSWSVVGILTLRMGYKDFFKDYSSTSNTFYALHQDCVLLM